MSDAQGETADGDPAGGAGRARRREGLRRGPLGPVLAAVLVVVFGAIGLGAGAVVNSSAEALYASEAVVRVYNPYRLNGSQFGAVDPVTVVNLEQQYAQSPSVEDAADAELDERGAEVTSVQWTPQTAAATLTVRCLTREAEDSATCAEVFAATYIDQRTATLARPLTEQVANLTATIDSLTEQIKVLQEAINESSSGTGAPSDRNRGRLAQQQALLTQLSNASQARDEAQAQARVVSGNLEVVGTPEVPDSLAQPAVTRNLAVGAAVGLLVGLMVAVAGIRRAGSATPDHS